MKISGLAEGVLQWSVCRDFSAGSKCPCLQTWFIYYGKSLEWTMVTFEGKLKQILFWDESERLLMLLLNNIGSG